MWGVAWNPSDKYSGVTLSNSNKTAAILGGTRGGVRASQGRSNDGSKYYFEIKIDTVSSANDVLGMVGISTTNHAITSYNSTLSGSNYVKSLMFSKTSANALYYAMSNYGSNVCPNCAVNDVIGVAVDFSANQLRFYRNGTLTTYHSILDSLISGTIYPSWSGAVDTNNDSVTLRETASEMAYLPSGFLAWDGTSGAPPDKSWLLMLFNGLPRGLKGAAKSAIPYFDGNKFAMKEAAGATTRVLTLDANGDLVWASTLPTANIADNAVNYAKIQQVSATDKVLGRSSAGAGVVEEITCTSAGRALIDDANAAAQRATLGTGYALPIVAQIQSTPVDGETIYFGGIVRDVTTTGGNRRMYIPRAGKIKAAIVSMYCGGTTGSNESISAYIRLNNTTDTLIQTVGNTDTWKTFSNASLDMAVTAGDYIEIKVVQPTWATNPTNVGWGGAVFIE